MKNAIIGLLSLLLVFFILYALGAFRYGSGIDRNYRADFVKKRIAAVRKSPQIILKTTRVRNYNLSVEAAAGMRIAVKLLNQAGGVLGKPLRLDETEIDFTQEANRHAVQKFCEDFSAAVYLGPSLTEYVASIRALTQYQGLPCVSVMDVSHPMPESGEPRWYISLYPPLELWADAIVDDLRKHKFSQLLIVSPRGGSYGWFYASAVEQCIRQQLPASEIFRINFSSPLHGNSLIRGLNLYQENRDLEAVVFAGLFPELQTFDKVFRTTGTSIPVYGCDAVDFPEIEEASRQFHFPLIVPECHIESPGAEFVNAYRQKYGTPPSSWAMLGAQSVYLTAAALRRDGGYDPDRLIKTMYLLSGKQVIPGIGKARIVLKTYNVGGK